MELPYSMTEVTVAASINFMNFRNRLSGSRIHAWRVSYITYHQINVVCKHYVNIRSAYLLPLISKNFLYGCPYEYWFHFHSISYIFIIITLSLQLSILWIFQVCITRYYCHYCYRAKNSKAVVVWEPPRLIISICF